MSIATPVSTDQTQATASAAKRTTRIRIPGMALKAEIVLGLQLILRHRAPRITGKLTIAGVGLAALSRNGMVLEDRQRILLLAVGTVVAVCCSRPFAPG